MCGITGFIDFRESPEGSDEHVLVNMRDSLAHRGPDDAGAEMIQTDKVKIGLAFRRLSIIELSSLGHQPMTSEDKNCAVVFNGEIYNFREIRKELEKDGMSFRSDSDTEVVLKSYIKWGGSCVHRFIGMFAICIYDKKENKIIMLRDRAGVKPLFYYFKDGLFLFASELKAFHKHPSFHKELNMDALSLYFRHGYISDPYTIFKYTRKVKPGHRLELNLGNQEIHLHKYWDVAEVYNKPKLQIDFNEATEETEKVLTSAFQYRMVSDVPVGVFLSGGYDSTAVAALLQKNSSEKIKTFTIGFHEEAYNEAKYAKQVAKHIGTDHHEHYCTFKEAMDIIPEIPEYYDEPFGDSSAIPTMLVSRIAKQKVSVALSADGGDEIFAGYPSHKKVFFYYRFLNKIPGPFARSAAVMMKRLHKFGNQGLAYPDRLDKLRQVLVDKNPVAAFNVITQAMTFNEVQRLIAHPVKYLPTEYDSNESFSDAVSPYDRMLATDYKTYLVDDILQKVDRATMSVGLEGREPFLDHRVIEWVARLPISWKLNKGVSKYILREIVHKYVPRSIMERPKMGFGVPVSLWCKHELKDMMLSYLDDGKIREAGIFEHKPVALMIKKYMDNKPVDFPRIWFLLMFQMWHEKWMT